MIDWVSLEAIFEHVTVDRTRNPQQSVFADCVA